MPFSNSGSAAAVCGAIVPGKLNDALSRTPMVTFSLRSMSASLNPLASKPFLREVDFDQNRLSRLDHDSLLKRRIVRVTEQEQVGPRSEREGPQRCGALEGPVHGHLGPRRHDQAYEPLRRRRHR